jgi:Icc protein
MPTTLIQITDAHLFADRQRRLRGVPTYETLAAVLEEARRRCPDPHWLILTGDLSHDHSEEAYRHLHELLGDWAERTLVVPGNHDDRAALLRVFPNEEASERCVTFRKELDPWQLIGLDTHLPGELAGELSEEQIETAHYWLAEYPDRPTIIFLHHPPLEVKCEYMNRIGLRNVDALAWLVGRNPGVRGIFGGHLHADLAEQRGELGIYTTPSTAFQLDPDNSEVAYDFVPPGFRIIELDDDGERFDTCVVRLAQLQFPPKDDA